MYFVYLSFRLCVCFACDVSCGLLVSNRIFDVTCQSLIKDEKKNTPQLFSTKCRQWNLGLIYHIVRKKSVHQNAWNWWSFTVDTKMFQTDFFLLTSEEFRLTIGTLSEFEDWMSMTLRIYSLNRKYPQFLFYNSFGKNIISKLYTSWLLTIATICYKVDGLGFWIIGKKPVLIVIFSSKGKVNINRRKW